MSLKLLNLINRLENIKERKTKHQGVQRKLERQIRKLMTREKNV